MAPTIVTVSLFFAFLIIIVPFWLILHYIAKIKSAKTLSREDEQILSDLWQAAQKMETRINSIETILDKDNPKWRNKI
ncbi:MAG: envelope stress response membrane protein PspB [Pseudomonadota bacterium]